MPKQVKLGKNKEFTFRSAGGGQASKYPWDAWFNGDLLMLEKGTDFDVEAKNMPGKIKSAARRRYKVVQISLRDADGNKLVDSLIIKSRDMMADERTAEDIRRAEAKEGAKSGSTPAETAAA